MSPPRRLAAIQPYFFPYIGYFQLIAACDEFVLLDDVQYVTRRWINRNRILVNGAPSWITWPVRHASRELAINQRCYVRDSGVTGRILNQLMAAYRRAPQCAPAMALVSDALGLAGDSVARVNARAIQLVADRIGLATPILLASDVSGARSPGQDGIIELCRQRGATTYVNPSGGRELYDAARFTDAGLSLEFLQFETPAYPQFEGRFVPGLSIVDVLMFNAPEAVRSMTRRAGTIRRPTAPPRCGEPSPGSLRGGPDG
jgi:hypothetical protein